MSFNDWYPKQSNSERKNRLEFGKAFRSKRLEGNYSKKEFAMLLNISLDLVNRIEKGYVSPDISGIRERLNWINKKKIIIA